MVQQKQIEESKRQLRSVAKQKRDALSPVEITQRSDRICKILEEQTAFKEAGTIYFYYPLGSEVNLLPLAQTALNLGKKTAFPRVMGNDMEFYQVSDLKRFEEGAFHVMEPLGGEKMCDGDALVLVPGLAFDAHGSRMGYGKGYYDRYFSCHLECQKIGVCYELQLVLNVPCEEYDVFMDAVVTEEKVIVCGNPQDRK